MRTHLVLFIHTGSNSNLTVGQFVDALKTVIINGLAYRGLLDPNCEDDGATLLDNPYSFLKPSSISLPSLSTSHEGEITNKCSLFFYCSVWCFVC